MTLCSVPPKIILRTNSSSNIEVKASETAVINCHVTGTPTPTVQWLVNGQLIDRTDQRYYISRDAGTLKITDVKVSDAGQYTCIAKNSVGIAERDFNLDVLGMSPSHCLTCELNFIDQHLPRMTYRKIQKLHETRLELSQNIFASFDVITTAASIREYGE